MYVSVVVPMGSVFLGTIDGGCSMQVILYRISAYFDLRVNLWHMTLWEEAMGSRSVNCLTLHKSSLPK